MQGRTIRIRPSWIIWYAVLLHALWGVLLLTSPAPYGATAIHVYNSVPRFALAALLFLASGLATWAITRPQPSWRTLAALLPQQALLTISAYAALLAVIGAHYGDGVIRPRLFILADQAPIILTMLLHTAAVVELHARRSAEDVLRTAFGAMNDEAERLRAALMEKAATLRRLESRPRRR
jgi:hypothetical protein